MAEYIDRGKIRNEVCKDCTYRICADGCAYSELCEKLLAAFIEAEPAADVAPVVHGIPMLRYRPKRYERYKEYGLNENGEMLYLKQVLVDEKNYAMYCPACGKRICSRFINYCPACGAKMDLTEPDKTCSTCGAYDPDIGVCDHDKSPVMQTGPDNTCPFWWSAE